MILVIGSKGLVSKVIQHEFTNYGMTVVGSDVAKTWISSNAKGRIRDYVNSLPVRPTRIINCAGLTNPRLSKQLLIEVNFELPKNLLNFSREEEIELITFGSIMENNPVLCQENPYLLTKEMYFKHFSHTMNSDSKQLHVQLHTLYGGSKIHPHMFLGQMFKAIQEGNDFKMTNGLQWREYHHVADEIQALNRIISTKSNGVVEISHNEKLTLRSIAEFVFSEFNILSRLKVGELPSPDFEQYIMELNQVQEKPITGFRPTLTGIADYLRELVGKLN